MLDHSHNGSSGKNRNWNLSGLGSAYSLQPDTLYRGCGWGRMIDSDFFTGPLVTDFRCNAAQATSSAKERTKNQ